MVYSKSGTWRLSEISGMCLSGAGSARETRQHLEPPHSLHAVEARLVGQDGEVHFAAGEALQRRRGAL